MTTLLFIHDTNAVPCIQHHCSTYMQHTIAVHTYTTTLLFIHTPHHCCSCTTPLLFIHHTITIHTPQHIQNTSWLLLHIPCTKNTHQPPQHIPPPQLGNLYGPLLACVTASACAYDAMIRQHSSDGTRASFVRAIQQDPHGPAGIAYRHWMRVVFQPLNQRASAIIEEHLGMFCG